MKNQRSLRQVLATAGLLVLLAACGTPAAETAAATAIATVQASEPAGVTPAPVTAANPRFPLTGSVKLEEGRCCIAGVAGATVQVRADFAATSPAGKVTKMRVMPASACASEAKMEDADWGPFMASKTFPAAVSTNWVGFYVSAQFQDEHGNLSPVYCDDISVEGSPGSSQANPGGVYPKIQCFSADDVHPGQGETVTGSSVTFSWPDTNKFPESVYYDVSVYGAGDNYTALVASGQTQGTSITLDIPRERAGDMVWYVTLVDASGTMLNHGQCSSFSASLLTVDPPTGIKGIHFTFEP